MIDPNKKIIEEDNLILNDEDDIILDDEFDPDILLDEDYEYYDYYEGDDEDLEVTDEDEI
jgi:hypothetical protein